MLPLKDDNITVNTPIATYALVAINVFCWFFLQGAGTTDALNQSICSYGFIPANLSGSHLDTHYVAQCGSNSALLSLLTSMFMHGGWMHLIGNVWFLWIFGDNVEDSMGPAKFTLLYLLSGIVASLAQFFSHTDSLIPIVGASGAIGGVMGAYILFFPRVRVHTLAFIFVIRVPAGIMLGYWFAVQTIGGITASKHTGGVAFWAHIGGFLAGLGLGQLLKDDNILKNHPESGWQENKPRPKDQWDNPDNQE